MAGAGPAEVVEKGRSNNRVNRSAMQISCYLEEVMNLEDWLYGETDDACAICGVRGPQILTVHHIDQNSSNNVYDNTIILCHNCP